MKDAFTLPTVFILRQAMDVIRREALNSEVETGGILIGAKSRDGALLVTHATPPGPQAVHHAYYFQRDVAYQQSLLNKFHNQYGVQYLGEWHKHPRNLAVPSGGDAKGVHDLLHDRDYGVDGILFPIIICESDLGFQLHPFYVTRLDPEMRFHPMKWHEIDLAMEPDRAFSSSVAHQTKPAIQQDESANKQPETTPATNAEPERLLRKLASWVQLPFLAEDRQKVSERRSEETASTEKEPAGKTIRWYETQSGRSLLAREQSLLQSFGLRAEPFLIGEGNLCFSFPRTGGYEIVVVCSPQHPARSPQILIRNSPSAKHQPIPGLEWTPQSTLADVIVPLLGPEIQSATPVSAGESANEQT